MYASTFSNILAKEYPGIEKNHYKGDYAFNKYPRDLADRHFILWNSDSELPGTHWRILYRHPTINIIDLFDPLGLSNDEIKGMSLTFEPKADIEFNSSPVQKKTSNSCGYYCLYFSIHRILNPDLSMRQIVTEDFSSTDLDDNLLVIKNFFKHHGIIIPTN